jgi:hypothetical protein
LVLIHQDLRKILLDGGFYLPNRIFTLSTQWYTTGTTTSVRIMEFASPPMMTHAMPFLAAELPNENTEV